MRFVLLALFLLGCQAPAYPVTPSSAALSTFRVNVKLDGEMIGAGTGWVVSNEGGYSRLITAGHVCAGMLPGVPLTFTLTGRDSKLDVPATVVRSSDTPDLCLLRAQGVVGPELAVSPLEPTYDEPLAYVGAPSAIYGDGSAPLYRGSFAGGRIVSIPTAPGASGSAIFSSNGVVGVLVAVGNHFDSLTYIETRENLLSFLAAQ